METQGIAYRALLDDDRERRAATIQDFAKALSLAVGRIEEARRVLPDLAGAAEAGHQIAAIRPVAEALFAAAADDVQAERRRQFDTAVVTARLTSAACSTARRRPGTRPQKTCPARMVGPWSSASPCRRPGA